MSDLLWNGPDFYGFEFFRLLVLVLPSSWAISSLSHFLLLVCLPISCESFKNKNKLALSRSLDLVKYDCQRPWLEGEGGRDLGWECQQGLHIEIPGPRPIISESRGLRLWQKYFFKKLPEDSQCVAKAEKHSLLPVLSVNSAWWNRLTREPRGGEESQGNWPWGRVNFLAHHSLPLPHFRNGKFIVVRKNSDELWPTYLLNFLNHFLFCLWQKYVHYLGH